MFAGIGSSGYAICPRTTSAIVCSEKPWALLEEKASSRFGPSVPVDFASASVWQEAHEPLLVVARKSCFP